MPFTLKLYEPFAPAVQFTKVGPVNGDGVKVTLVIGTLTPFKATVMFCDAGVACPGVVSVNETWLGVAMSPLPFPAVLPTVSETLIVPVSALVPFAVTKAVPL